MKFSVLDRKIHYWASIVVALPLLAIIGAGIFLQLKKEWSWVQPPTQKGSGKTPTLSFHEILEVAKTVPEAEIKSWDDVERLDVRPDKGVVKVRAENRWEIQIDTATGDVLQVAYRRSDVIESIHDGSWFFGGAKLWIFLPAAIILLGLWFTGMYLFILPYWVKWRRQKA